MPTARLPEEPSFEQLRKQAKDLQRAVRAMDPVALAEVGELHPEDSPAAASFPLQAAQLVVARRYGFASWWRLKRHVEIVTRFARFPVRMNSGPAVDAADEFLRLACLSYEDDQPERRERGLALLRSQPGLTLDSACAAAAAADVGAMQRILRADPGAASREGGPYRLEPMVYLAYARHDPGLARDQVMTAARLLLRSGADPNAGYLWHGLHYPFTVLTGVLGEGEQGPVRQPRHPHWRELARLLLVAGADPNDGQGLYNRMFQAGAEHLELLLSFGLGTGDGGPWRDRMGERIDSPAEMVRRQLRWAIEQGMTDRVRLLAEYGVDVAGPFGDGVTPATLAVTAGYPDLVEELTALGAPAPELSPAEEFAAAALAADRPRVADLLARHPHAAADARRERPGLIVWAVAHGRPGAVELLAQSGFDVNARGRTDTPARGKWLTPLHAAAQAGDLDLARRLLALGSDPLARDKHQDATPLDWARYFDRPELVELLEPLTAAPDGPAAGR